MIRQPEPVRHPDMPARVRIYEVGPRDGLQNETRILPVEDKAEFVRRLLAAGLDAVELTSFVSPSWVPQLADAEALLGLLGDDGRSAHRPVLVPNEKGLDRALQCRVGAVAVMASATESFAQRNLGRSVAAAMAMIEPVVTRAKDEGLWVRGYLSMCFGDPWEGHVPVDAVVVAGRALLALGCDELSLGDTIGVATPGQVRRVLTLLLDAGVRPEQLAVHFHDTYGQALANALEALRLGVLTVDSSAGGLGGCPYAESATGNLATEDLVWALTGLGVQTGVDLDALLQTSAWLAGLLGRPSPSRVVRALTEG